MKKTKNKNRDAQKKRTSHKAVESVLSKVVKLPVIYVGGKLPVTYR